jgi:hypothetical protein
MAGQRQWLAAHGIFVGPILAAQPQVRDIPINVFFRANSMANSFGLFFLRTHDNFRLLRQKYRTQKAKDQIRNVNDDRSQNIQNKCVFRFF